MEDESIVIGRLGPGSDASPTAGTRRIGAVTRILHWGVAALLVSSFGAAWTFNALGPGPVAAWLVEVHRSVGLVILGLMLLRVLWRLRHPLPPIIGIAAWERWLAATVQLALYGCLIVMPVLGWLGSNAQGDTVTLLGRVPMPSLVDADDALGETLFRLHGSLGFVILGLLGLHIAGAVRHYLIKRDAVLRSMVFGTSR